MNGAPWGQSGTVEQIVVLHAIHGDSGKEALQRFRDRGTNGGSVHFAGRDEAVHVVGFMGRNPLLVNGKVPKDVDLPEPSSSSDAIPSFSIAAHSRETLGPWLTSAGSRALLLARGPVASEAYVLQAVLDGLAHDDKVWTLEQRTLKSYAKFQNISERVERAVLSALLAEGLAAQRLSDDKRASCSIRKNRLCARGVRGFSITIGRNDMAPAAWFRELAEGVVAGGQPDQYGEGLLVESFEREVAAVLGKEAALFFPSGTMAQQIALRIWSERRNLPKVAFHPTCHLELHEHAAYRVLHGIEAELVGQPQRLFTTADLRAVREPLAALLVELPQREIGGQLPAWEELESIAAWAKEQNVVLHLDGARLWETQPFYAKPYAEIVAPFSSVYVSFYKTLGGVAGALLAGPEDFVAEARVWRRRHGGTLIHLFPMVLSAQASLRERLPKIGAYCAKAKTTAAALAGVDGVEVLPNPPHTNMMHVFLRGDRERLEQTALDVARDQKLWLFKQLSPTSLPTLHRFELSVGDATLELDDGEIAGVFADLLERAR